MKKMLRSLLALGLLGGVALLIQPSDAQAAVTIKINDSPVTHHHDSLIPDTVWYKGDHDGFGVDLTASWLGSTPDVARLLTFEGVLRGLDGWWPIGNHKTLTVEISRTFDQPISDPLILDSGFLITWDADFGGSVTFKSRLEENGAILAETDELTLSQLLAHDRAPSVLVNGVTGPYTLTSIATFTLHNLGSMSLAGETTATATPEPGTMAMAVLAAPLLVLGYRRHRRATSRT